MSGNAVIKDKGVVRVGLFGGTFNPVHWGHLRAAEEIREQFSLDQVIFIPTNISPHKKSRELVSAVHRMHMIEVAVSKNPYFTVSDIELRRSGKSYSIETLNYFKEVYKDRFTPFFIIGVDAFLEIDTWKDFRNLFSLCNFVVMTRPGYEIQSAGSLIPHQVSDEFTYNADEHRFIHCCSPFSIYLAEITAIAISSHAIRNFIKKGRSVKYLLPEDIENYILEHRFYFPEDSSSS